MAEQIEFNDILVPSCDAESFDLAFSEIKNRSLLYNKDDKTLHIKWDGEDIQVGVVDPIKSLNDRGYAIWAGTLEEYGKLDATVRSNPNYTFITTDEGAELANGN